MTMVTEQPGTNPSISNLGLLPSTLRRTPRALQHLRLASDLTHSWIYAGALRTAAQPKGLPAPGAQPPRRRAVCFLLVDCRFYNLAVKPIHPGPTLLE